MRIALVVALVALGCSWHELDKYRHLASTPIGIVKVEKAQGDLIEADSRIGTPASDREAVEQNYRDTVTTVESELRE